MSSRSLPARNLASRRAPAPHTSMFLRMLLRAAWLRPGRALAALLAMIVAAAASTAILNLYVDVQAKLRQQFRDYGANIVVVAGELHGNIDAAVRVEIQDTGMVVGDVKAGSLTVAAGSRMRGQVEFGWGDKSVSSLSNVKVDAALS